jgi:prepilin signal peptidase PulO-like enzyme (type II secretory pathway)
LQKEGVFAILQRIYNHIDRFLRHRSWFAVGELCQCDLTSITRKKTGHYCRKKRMSKMQCTNPMVRQHSASFVVRASGKCRNCKTPISWQYPAVELFFGLLFFVTAIFTPSGEHILLIWRLVIVFALGIMMLSDIRYMDIPDKVSLPIIGFLLLSTGTNTLLLQTDGIPDFFSAAIGAGTIYLFFTLQIIIPSIIMSIQKRSYKIICCALASIIVFPMWLLASLLFLGKAFERFLEEETEEEMPSWIGGGDLRIAIIIGLALGWKIGILAVFLAYILGTIFALPLLALTKKTASSLIPFGPFLAIGLITCLFWGNDIWEWYIRLLGIV